MSFNDFKDELAEALGAEAAGAAKREMEENPDVASGVDATDPEEQVRDQATAIAAAIKTYLISLAGSDSYVKKPGGS
jgi:hypothetical protein